MLHEPTTTALILVIASLLLALATLLGRASDRFGIPVMLGFLLVGMLAGEDGPGRIPFSNHQVAFRIGSAALALILFEGGLNTPLGLVRANWKPAGLLATLGVLGVAAMATLGGRLLGFPWGEAALLGAVLSCTDAAAVFAILRGQNLRLKRRVGGTLELEAGLNDPMAVALTMTLTEALVPGLGLQAGHLLQLPLQLAIGAFAGWGVGYLGSRLLAWAALPASGLYPVLTVALAGLGFGLPTLMGGSGFLGVYVAGLVIAHQGLPYRASLLRVHAALSWIAQTALFLILGLLITPSRLGSVAVPGLALAVFVTLLARPLAVLACLAPFGFSLREMVYIGWVGLRGAVPIVLATIPVMAGVPASDHLLHVVFVVIVAGTLLPGATLRWATRRLGMNARGPAKALAHMDLHSEQALDGEVLTFTADAATPGLGGRLDGLDLPEGTWLVSLVRGKALLPPSPEEQLQSGDQLIIAFRKDRRAALEQRLGEPS